MKSMSKNLLNRVCRDIESLCKLEIRKLSSLVEGSNLFGLFKGKLGQALRTPLLLNHVLGVIPGHSDKEMGGVYAVPNIARVADEGSFWNLASKKFPRKTIGLMASRFVSAFFVGMKLPIASRGYDAIPKPTAANLVKLVNKPFVNIKSFHRHLDIMPYVMMEGKLS
jgi:hypothetical protein